LITIDDIRAAADRIGDKAVHTPLLRQVWDGRELWLKPENLKPVGAFKVRGAVNALAALDETTRARGVVSYSSGNHAQAVAYAARQFDVPATIVVQEGAPEVKVAATKAYGAQVVEAPMAERSAVAHRLAERLDRVIIAPFDHADVIAGQGTVGLEIAEDLPDVRTVLVPVSGGGLASGVGVAITTLCPNARVIGVEPELAGDTAESLRAGRLVRWDPADRARTIADGLRAEPSQLTFAHLRATLDGVVTVTEDEIRQAMRVLATRAKLVAEPSGAVSTAAWLFHQHELPAGPTVAIVSGGNVDARLLAEVLTEQTQ